MRLRQVAPVLGLTVLTMTAGACTKSSTAPAAISLSQVEVDSLFAQIGAVLGALGTPTFSRAANLGGGPMMSIVLGPNFNAAGPISGSGNCPGGGTASVSGNLSSTTTTVSFDFTASFNGCKTIDYTVGGSIRETGNYTFTSTTISGSVSSTGNLSVTASGGRSGNCSINVNVTESGSLTAPTITATGSVCGVSVSTTVT